MAIPVDSSSIPVESNLIPVDSCGFQSHSGPILADSSGIQWNPHIPAGMWGASRSTAWEVPRLWWWPFFWLLDMSSWGGCVLVYLYILISIVTKIVVSAWQWVRAVEIGSQSKAAMRIVCGQLISQKKNHVIYPPFHNMHQVLELWCTSTVTSMDSTVDVHHKSRNPLYGYNNLQIL